MLNWKNLRCTAVIRGTKEGKVPERDCSQLRLGRNGIECDFGGQTEKNVRTRIRRSGRPPVEEKLSEFQGLGQTTKKGGQTKKGRLEQRRETAKAVNKGATQVGRSMAK